MTRVLLDAEALLLGSTGVLAVAIPEAFVRMLGFGDSTHELFMVPAAGSIVVGFAALQFGVVGMGDRLPLRLLLQCRLLVDVLIAITMWTRAGSLAAPTQTVLLGSLSLALIFAAVRFHALVLVADGTLSMPTASPAK